MLTVLGQKDEANAVEVAGRGQRGRRKSNRACAHLQAAIRRIRQHERPGVSECGRRTGRGDHGARNRRARGIYHDARNLSGMEGNGQKTVHNRGNRSPHGPNVTARRVYSVEQSLLSSVLCVQC